MEEKEREGGSKLFCGLQRFLTGFSCGEATAHGFIPTLWKESESPHYLDGVQTNFNPQQYCPNIWLSYMKLRSSKATCQVQKSTTHCSSDCQEVKYDYCYLCFHEGDMRVYANTDKLACQNQAEQELFLNRFQETPIL